MPTSRAAARAMSATWAPSPRPVGAATGSPLTIWLPVAVFVPVDVPLLPDVPLTAAGFPLPTQMPVFGSQLAALLAPEPEPPALLAPEPLAPVLLPEPPAPLALELLPEPPAPELPEPEP